MEERRIDEEGLIEMIDFAKNLPSLPSTLKVLSYSHKEKSSVFQFRVTKDVANRQGVISILCFFSSTFG
jgi:hypothetical protein